MSNKKKIFSYLQELFPNPKTELNYKNEFQLIVAVILSAQNTDIQVNKITKNIFNFIKTPQNILHIGLEKFTKSISSINYYKTKAKHIFHLAEILGDSKKLEQLGISETARFTENHQSYLIPTSLLDLQKLPGIGEKTAKVIAHVLYNLPVIAVDTHVHRVCNRRGRVHTKSPEQTSKLLENIIPKEYISIAHHTIVLFGRYYCTARKPKCETCKIQHLCKRYQSLG